MADNGDESVVVMGLGRFGGALAAELVRQGTEVLAIDSDPKVVQSYAGDLPHVVTADTTDEEALEQLGVPEFHRAVVAIGTDIQSSIMTTSLLVDLEIGDIWAKAISRQHGRILRRVGAHHVVLPEHDIGERVAHLLTGRILDYTQVDDDYAVVKTTPPHDAVDVPLGESKIRSRYGVTVVAVKCQAHGDGSRFTHVTDDTVLAYGDIILVLGRIHDVERFANLP